MSEERLIQINESVKKNADEVLKLFERLRGRGKQLKEKNDD